MAIAGAAAIVALCWAAYDPRVFIDGDTNWHVAAGRWILAHRTVPLTDPFSFTYAGKPWIAHEWLSEVLMASAYLAAGWSGVVLFIGACAALAMVLLARELRLWLGPLGQVIGLTLAFTCLQPFLYARPHIIATPLLIFWATRLLAARRAGRAPQLELALLMAVWANLHASFIFGLALIGPFAAEAFFAQPNKLKTALEWGLFGVVSTAFSLATPHGFAGLIFPFMVMTMKVLPSILEWRGQNFQDATPSQFEVAVLATLFLGLWRGIRVPVFRLILLLGLLHMALQHVRQQAVLAALAPVLLAEPFGRAAWPDRAGPRLAPPVGWTPNWRVPSWLIAAVIVGLVGLIVVARLAQPLVRHDNGNVPVTAFAKAPAQLLTKPVFNEYAFGGYLIFKGVKPYVDGRADMYGDDFVQEYLAVAGGQQPNVDNEFKRWNIAWAIVSPRDGLVRTLTGRPGWIQIYSDPYAVVFARQDALQPSAAKAAAQPAASGAAH
jgi:hypothetical protein